MLFFLLHNQTTRFLRAQGTVELKKKSFDKTNPIIGRDIMLLLLSCHNEEI